MRMLVERSTIQSLMRACSVEDARSAEEAVKALGNLAANENHAHKIVEAGGAHALVRNISAEGATKSMVAACCEALAAMIDHDKPRTLIVQGGAVGALANVILNGSAAHKEAVGSVLVSLCVDLDLSEAAVREGVLESLTSMATTASEVLQEEIAWAFASLSASACNAEPMADSIVLKMLLDILKEQLQRPHDEARPKRPKVCMQATWALANLSVHSMIKPILAEHGAVDELVRQLVLWNEELSTAAAGSELSQTASLILQQATRAIANLACVGTIRSAMASSLAPILHVVSQCARADESTSEICSRALANLTLDESIAARFVNAGGVRILLAHLLEGQPVLRVRKDGLKIILNVSALAPTFPSAATEVMAEGVLNFVVTSLNSHHTNSTQQAAVNILSNLACGTNMQHKIALIKCGTLRQLSSLIDSELASLSIKDASAQVSKELSSVLTPTSRRALVQAVGMTHAADGRGVRRFGTGGAASARPRRSSPLAQVQAAVY